MDNNSTEVTTLTQEELRAKAKAFQDAQLAEYEAKYMQALDDIKVENEEYSHSLFGAIFGAISALCILFINLVSLGNATAVRYRASSVVNGEIDDKVSAKRSYRRLNRINRN